MHISECEEVAKTLGCERPKFTITGPGGTFGAEWLDPWMGILRLDGQKGFLLAKDFYGLPIDCSEPHCDLEGEKNG